MATYDNAYEILTEVRYAIDEYSSALVQATDTYGAYSNASLMKKINGAQRFLYNFLFTKKPELFLTSTTLTGVSSVYTLPADFGVLKEFRDDDGAKVYPITVDKLKLDDSDGSDRLYYRKGNTLVLDKDGVTDVYTLWYHTKCREIHSGMSSAGGVKSLTLDASYAKKIVDYYNGMTIENVTDDWVDTITSYTTGRVATITNTGAASKYYGIVSELPEMFHCLIVPKAVIEAKLMPQSKEKPNETELLAFYDNMRETYRAYAGSQQDTDWEDVFCDFGPSVPYSGGIITD